MTRLLTTTVWVRLTIALLVAGWTITVGLWQNEDTAGGDVTARATTGYWPCGEIRHLARSTYRASDIEVAGLGCGDTRDFVRRVHAACRVQSCDVGGYACEVAEDGAASCQRPPADRVRWVWTGGQRTG